MLSQKQIYCDLSDVVKIITINIFTLHLVFSDIPSTFLHSYMLREEKGLVSQWIKLDFILVQIIEITRQSYADSHHFVKSFN